MRTTRLAALPVNLSQRLSSASIPALRPAIAHPKDGAEFRQRMQELLHRLRDTHGVRNVHVLPCASNAACVFFGQAFDSYHPELVIYDFASDGNSMVPRLGIANVNNECRVKAVGAAH